MLNKYLLTSENDHFKKHQKRLVKLDAKKIRDLRNKLTHFYGVGKDGLSLANSMYDKESRGLEKDMTRLKQGHIFFLSEKDLFELLKFAHILTIKEWNDDSSATPIDFARKMKVVLQVIDEEAPIDIFKQE